MEENLTILREGSRVSESDVRGYSPLTLAYIGDAVYELLIRTMVVTSANAPVNKLHKKSSLLAKAPAQSAMAEALLPAFTEEELAVYKRGRNAHSYTKAKNATTGDYRRATGFEAVFGYLYLKGDMKRIDELFQMAVESTKHKGQASSSGKD